jgi:transcriptional regulator with XRE-family HTH domain
MRLLVKVYWLNGYSMEKSIISADYRSFLNFLKKTRVDVGLTQIQIAKKLKITQSQVSKIERGERRLDFIELRRWLRSMGVPIVDFVGGFETYLKKNKLKQSRQKDS